MMRKSFIFLFIFLLINSFSNAQVEGNKDSASAVIPATPAKIAGKTLICPGTVQTYTIDPVKNATSYFWTLPSGWTGSSTTTSITTTAGDKSGNVSVLSMNGTTISKLTRSLAISVSIIPDKPGKIKGDSVVCIGVLKTYSIDPVARATYYTWTLPSGWKGTSTSNSITVITGNKGGNISVSAGNICGSGIAQNMSVETNPVPDEPGKITTGTTTPEGNYKIYTIEPVKGATSYSWTLPAGWIGASTTTSIKAIPGPSGGTITVKANNNCGSSNASKPEVTK